MKKTQLLVCAMSVACSIAYGQKTQVLDTRILEGWDEAGFFYNDKNQLDSMTIHIMGNQPYKAYRTFEYDEKGMNTRENGYQYLNGKFKHIFYVDYTYNEDGQMKTRLNYNSTGGDECKLSAKMEWSYKDGRIDKVSTYFPSWTVEGEFDLFSEERYIYKDNVLQAREIWTIPYSSTELHKASSTEYTYNQSGQMEEEFSTNYDTENGNPTSTVTNVYTYDQNGNLIEYANYPQNREEPALKYVYVYNEEVKRENVVLPYNFEDAVAPHYIAMMNSTNIIEKEEWWQVPQEADHLVHGGDYIWTYSKNTSSIDHKKLPNLGINFFIHNESLYFQGLAEGQLIQLFDVNGSLIIQDSYKQSGISLNTLPKGIYLIRTSQGAFRFVK